jgi:diguanylate cyclase (GGDEF)-like protein/PAS domain S-box-containing protein
MDLAELFHEISAYHAEIEIQNDQLRLTQQKLEESHAKFLSLYNQAPVGYITLDREGSITKVNLAAIKLLELENKRYGGQKLPFLFEGDNRVAIEMMLKSSKPSFSCTLQLKQLNGNVKSLLIHGVKTEDQGADAILVTLTDNTAEYELSQNKQLFGMVIDSCSEACIVMDSHQRLLYANTALEQMTGLLFRQMERHGPEFFSYAGKQGRSCFQLILNKLNELSQWSTELTVTHQSGEQHPVWLNANVIKNEQDKISHYVLMLSDYSTQRRFLNQLADKVKKDPLTGLRNRAALDEKLDSLQLQLDKEASAAPLAIAFIDIDDFKAINDRFGHAIGDQVIGILSSRILNSVRSQDFLARVGGDEFIIVFEGCELDVLQKLAEKLTDVIDVPLSIEGITLKIAVSLGISWSDCRANVDIFDLVRQADALMYQAKQAGKKQFRIQPIS